MSDNLPLIPRNKAACADVRPLLREVFRNLDAQPVLTNNLKREQHLKQNKSTDIHYDIDENSAQREKIKKYQDELKTVYAKTLGKNYPIKEETSKVDVSNLDWKKQFGIIKRQDLKPNIFEDMNHQQYQWMTDALNKKSCDPCTASKISQSLESYDYTTFISKHSSLQSVSYDEPMAAPPLPLPHSSSWPITPHHVACEPSRLDFVNFTTGHIYTRRIRLVNLSKYDIRLSIQPPPRTELRVELIGNQGLKLTSGSMLDLRVRFKPRDVCAFQVEIFIRTSLGSPVIVPIACFMVPPLLDVIVPNVKDTSNFSCDELPTNNDVLDLGARLLGDVHRVELQLQCNVEHASFYIMTEEAWCSFIVDQEAIWTGVVVVGAFCISPVRWQGSLRDGIAFCRAPTAGIRTIALRVLSSTAVVRPLHVVADAVMFSPEHVTLKTSEKDYDIFSEGDPNCLHYVHLGTGFPNKPLSSTIHLINNSSVPYSYYWSVRMWDEKFNPKENDDMTDCLENIYKNDKEAAELLSVERMHDVVLPRSSVCVRICASGAERPGMRRAALMLILNGIPRECIPPENQDMIISMETVQEKEIPGLCKAWSRSICQMLCTQLEVWWGVVPVRFVLQPPVVNLNYSTRLKSIEIPVEVTQLKGGCCVRAEWSGEEGNPRVLPLMQSRTVCSKLRVPLPDTDGEYHDTETYQLKALSGEWRELCSVNRCGHAPLAKLQPRFCWLNIHPPSAHLTTQLNISNNATSTINWNVGTYEWWGEHRGRVCPCDIVLPSNGSLSHNNTQRLTYQLQAPENEGSVLRLVELQQYEQQTRRRTTLVACRSLEPRVLIRVLPSNGETNGGEICQLEKSATKDRFSSIALIRPPSALTVGQRSYFLLCCTNITPVATTICWDKLSEHEHSLHISVVPDHIDVGPYARVTLEVCLEAIAVCGRSLWVQRASLLHSRDYLYLIVDTAIDGWKVTIDIPLKDYTDGVATIIKKQSGALQSFSNNDKRYTDKIVIENKPVESPPPWAGDCPCFTHSESATSVIYSPICIEFRNVSIDKGKCVLEPAGQCVRMRCVPASGQLPVGSVTRIEISVIADSWGMYKGQLILQIENMEQVTLDVWIEAVGAPLRFALKPNVTYEDPPTLWMSTSDPERRLQVTNTSCADILMYVCVLREHGKIAMYEHPQDSLPFRLYLRFFDTPKALSYEDGFILSFKYESQSSSQISCSCQEGPSTGIELFLCEDYGKLDDTIFQVEPRELTIAAGENASQVIKLVSDVCESSRAVLLVRTRPLQRYGSNWYRTDTPHQLVRLRVYGHPRLQLSCKTLQVKLSALQLPLDGVTRVRKYFQAMNVGDGVLTVKALTKSPWSIFLRNDNGAKCVPNCRKNSKLLLLELPPRSSVELCAALTIATCEWWPESPEDYSLSTITTTQLDFYDTDDVLITGITLSVMFEFPKLNVAPAEFDFGPVARGDARKTYFTISHSSTLCPLELLVTYEGDDVFTVSPKSLTLLPHCCGRFYVQYIASRWVAEASGKVRVLAEGLKESRGISKISRVSQSLGNWCVAYATLKATSTGDRARSLPPHDFTDDAVLLPKAF